MSNLTIYHQRRQDGAERTGVEIDGESVLQRFTGGPDADNPALLWYIDIRCEGEDLPGDAHGARGWLRQHADRFAEVLRKAAEHIAIGIDPDVWPYQYQAGLLGRARLRVVCSAVRHVDARELAHHLVEWAEQWDRLLGELSPVVYARG